MHYFGAFSLNLFLLFSNVLAEKWLDNFVSFYEVTNNHDFLSRPRRSTKTSLESGEEIVYPLRAFNRSFVLLLRQDHSIFSNEHEIESGGKVFKLKTPILVTGTVQGSADSFVHGSLINDRFEGEIAFGPEVFMVENAEKFLEKSPAKQASVVYRAADVTLNAHEKENFLDRRKRSVASEGANDIIKGPPHEYSLCGWSDEHIRSNLLDHQRTADYNNHKVDNKLTAEDQESGNIYSQAANTVHNHVKRAAINSETRHPGLLSDSSLLNKPKVCGLFLQVDHLLYDKYYKQANSDHDAVANIIAYLGFVAQKANFIYNSTEFHTRDGAVGPYRNIHVTIMRTKIYKTESEFAHAFDLRPTETITNLDATNFLNIVSRANNDKYCAVYVFTLRDFSSGILGLAWIGYPDAIQRGGVCDQYGATRTGRQSLNTGIVTLLNYGQQVNRLVSAITFSHELGHNFGAQHDNTPQEHGREPDPLCYPGGDDGNYIMYSSATSGLKPNNEKFSECSRDLIARNLNAILKSQVSKTNCFRDSDQPFCGNSVVDPGEDCDCGFKDDCGVDSNCCGAADDPQFRCRFKKVISTGKRAQCSLSNGVCCDVDTCEFVVKSEGYVCRMADECHKAAICNGSSAQCPRGTPEPDGKLCANRTKICQVGECAISSCEIITDGVSTGRGNGAKFSGCQSERPSGSTKYNRSELCFLSCKSPKTGKCYNSMNAHGTDFDPDFMKFLAENSNTQPIQLLAGSPCDNDRGYCDVFHRCRPINAEGPLSRLTDMLFSEQTINTLRSWVEKFWWAVALIGVGIIAFMIAFVKICSVHTPSDNRNLPPARSLADTLRRTAAMKPVVYLVNRGGPAHGRGPGHRRMAPGHIEGDSTRPPHRLSQQASAPPMPQNVQVSRSSRPPTYQETFA